MTDNKQRSMGLPAGRRTAPAEPKPWHPARAMGLARALQKAGYGTRRETEAMVGQGRVRIGDTVVTDPRHMVPAGADIFLDNRSLRKLELRYFALHKPLRVVCTAEDSLGRRHIQELFPSDVTGLAAAGRMDGRTTGLILVSNDTAWNNLVTTTQGLEQEYRVQVEGDLSDLEMSVMSAGVHLPGLGLFRPQNLRIVEIMKGHTVLNLTVREGKIRQVRRMLATLRHKVTLVRRVRIGEIRLSDLNPGAWRELSGPEVASIREIHSAIANRRDDSGGEE